MTEHRDDQPIALGDGFRLIREQVLLHPWPFTVAILGAAVFAGATVISTVVLGLVTDRLVYPTFADNDIPDDWLLWGSLGIVAVVVLRSAGVVARRYFAGMTSERVQVTFRHTLTERFLGLPLAWHQQTPTGQLLAHADNDTERMADVLHPLPFSLGAGFLALFSAVSLLVVDPVIALVAFSLFPSLFFLNRIYSRRVEGPAARAQAEVGRTSSVAHESFDGALIVKTLGRTRAEVDRFSEAANSLKAERITIGYTRAVFEAVLDALPGLGIVVVVVVGAYRIDAGVITRGDLVQVTSLFTVLAFPMRVFGFFLELLPPSVVARERLNLVLDEPVPEPIVDHTPLPTGPLRVVADDLRFAYPDGTVVFSGLNLELQPGEVVALVGSTGAGKSTLCTLLAGLVPPNSGRIVVGGQPIDRLGARERTEAVALVFQETFLFGAGIRSNIDLEDRCSLDEVRHAASVARIDDFVMSLPDGYDTVVGERGVTLSGGQRQRVALARALIRSPRFLILDDATSAVDPKVEQEILARLHDELETTTLVVAQRVATIELADRVVYLSDGRVAATGTHGELLANPNYQSLVMAYEAARP
jgi:ABC-type multidrug transport system fused ATPase/permease subunit